LRDQFPEGPFLDEVQYKLGHIFFDKADYKEAAKAFNQSSKSSNKELRINSLFHLGEANTQLQNYTQAVADYMKITYLYPKEEKWKIKVYYRIGELYERQGNTKQALNAYQKVVENAQDADLRKKALRRIGVLSAPQQKQKKK